MKLNTSTASTLSPRAVSEGEAARYLGVSQSSLRKGRMAGRRSVQMPSPPFVKMGRRVVYLIEDLDRWLQIRRNENELDIGGAQ